MWDLPARLCLVKVLRTFLAAADLIARSCLWIQVSDRGDGPEREWVQEKIRTGVLSGSVSYLGHVREIASFYNDLDCLVVPSTWEPQGLVEIEAQTLGVPVIASNTEP